MPRADEKGIELACRISPDVPMGVIGDPTRLKQVLLNLLNNAVKFTEKGEVLLTVETRRSRRERRRGARQSASSFPDTGIGIPGDRMDRLFRSFSQVDASTTRAVRRAPGLGLAISQRACRGAWADKIEVSSEVGGRIDLFLRAFHAPVQPAGRGEPAPPDCRSAGGAGTCRGRQWNQQKNTRRAPARVGRRPRNGQPSGHGA